MLFRPNSLELELVFKRLVVTRSIQALVRQSFCGLLYHHFLLRSNSRLFPSVLANRETGC